MPSTVKVVVIYGKDAWWSPRRYLGVFGSTDEAYAHAHTFPDSLFHSFETETVEVKLSD